MKIREATLADAPTVASIHTDSWRNTYQSVLTEKYLSDAAPKERNAVWSERLGSPKANQYIAAAETDNEIIGFLCVYAGGNKEWGSYLDNLHVREAHQYKGIGKILLLEAAHWCHQNEPTEGLCLLVNQDNVRAQEFYKYMGGRNAQKSVWNAPDGSVVPTYWFIWENLSDLVDKG